MEASPFSRIITQSLLKLNNLKTAEIDAICKYFLQNLLAGKSTIAFDEKNDDILFGVSTYFLESIKTQVSSDFFRATLTEFGVATPVVAQLTDLYLSQIDTLTKHMLETGISAPQLVDVDWRLDYHVRSKLGGKENKPIYFLVLKVREHGLLREIQMVASLEDVQDLAGKVKDALKQVDRVLTSKSD